MCNYSVGPLNLQACLRLRSENHIQSQARSQAIHKASWRKSHSATATAPRRRRQQRAICMNASSWL